jgi:hypothetical protein
VGDGKSDGNNSVKKGCMPAWISRSPRWLKVVLAASIALLVGAIVLVGVGLAFSLSSDNSNGSSAATSPDHNPSQFLPPTPAPTTAAAPTKVNIVTEPPAPTMTDPTDEGTGLPVSSSSTAAPVPSPTNLSASTAPTPTFDSAVTTFFVTGGRYTNTSSVFSQAAAGLPRLPTLAGNAFLSHLGDWNSPTETGCTEDSYQRVASLFSNSSIPVYFVVGDNEYNGKCSHYYVSTEMVLPKN